MNSKSASMEEVHVALMNLRQSSKRKFPSDLWLSIVGLTETHSLEEVSQRLQIHPVYLKRKIKELKNTRQQDGLNFQEVSFQGTFTETISIELRNPSGLSAKIQGSVLCLNAILTLFQE